VRQETFTFLYDRFTQDNTYQILSQLVRFCRLYIKKTFWYVFSVHSVYNYMYMCVMGCYFAAVTQQPCDIPRSVQHAAVFDVFNIVSLFKIAQ